MDAVARLQARGSCPGNRRPEDRQSHDDARDAPFVHGRRLPAISHDTSADAQWGWRRNRKTARRAVRFEETAQPKRGGTLAKSRAHLPRSANGSSNSCQARTWGQCAIRCGRIFLLSRRRSRPDGAIRPSLSSRLAESWIGRPIAREDNLPELVRRYLAAFGPASVTDAQTWLGMKLKETFEKLRPETANLSRRGATRVVRPA